MVNAIGFNCELFLYADDSTLVASGKNIHTIQCTLSNEVETLNVWLDCNKLSLHLGKTESILFASEYKLKQCACMNISCKGTPIVSQTSVKYLGATMHRSRSIFLLLLLFNNLYSA